MKLHADNATTPRIDNLGETKSIRLTTEPNNLGEFIEIQVAELRGGSLNVVVSGELQREMRFDSHGNQIIHVWPTAKKTEAPPVSEEDPNDLGDYRGQMHPNVP